MTSGRPDYPRLEDQIAWFDRKSSYHQAWYRRLKVLSVAAAALVPLASGFEGYAPLAGVLGVAVVVVEGIQHINQHHENWIRYRATCEGLRHEKYLYLAGAGHYEGQSDEEAFRHLAARVESVLSQESDAWLQLRRNLDEKPEKQPQPASD